MSSPLLKPKDKGFLLARGHGWAFGLTVLIVLPQRKSKLSMTAGTVTTCGWAPAGVSTLPSHGDWDTGVLSPLTITLGRDGFHVREEDSPGL